ncbi:MAG: DUF4399 domain-containing protein [Woeseiaceae bacterium]
MAKNLISDTVFVVTAFVILAGCSKPAETTAAVDEKPAATMAKPVLPRTAAPENGAVFFVSPKDGDTVTSPVTIKFGASNVAVVAAGNDAPMSGHHHLIIDAPLPDLTQPIPKNDQYRHFGGGQTETTIELAPGNYTLQMLMGDHFHIPHEPAITSDTITITVTE